MIRALFWTNNLLSDAILLSVCGAITICSATLCRDIALFRALLKVKHGHFYKLIINEQKQWINHYVSM